MKHLGGGNKRSCLCDRNYGCSGELCGILGDFTRRPYCCGPNAAVVRAHSPLPRFASVQRREIEEYEFVMMLA